jgi:hypothetical protein
MRVQLLMNKVRRILVWLIAGAVYGPLIGLILGASVGWVLVGGNTLRGNELAGTGAICGVAAGWFLGLAVGAWLGASGADPQRAIPWLVGGILTWVGVGLLTPVLLHTHRAADRYRAAHNLKLIAYALHNYADTYHGSFPAAAIPNEMLPPEQRLSWMAALLPFLEKETVYNAIDQTKSWDAEENRHAVNTAFPFFLSSEPPPQSANGGPGLTEYVGLAGVGVDSPFLPRDHPRAGAFGYDRGARLPADFKDGTSNTIIVAETGWANGPWASAGPATVRGLDTSRRPYVGKGRQFGGIQSPGANIALGDGSVRFLHEGISSATVEALATMAGNERTGDF